MRWSCFLQPPVSIVVAHHEVARFFEPLALAGSMLLVLPPVVTAQTFQGVFNKQYIRVAGAPAAASDVFKVCDPHGSFRLVVINGVGGQSRVSAGSVWVNGLAVIKEQDFNQQVARIERPLAQISESNRLDVRLRSAPVVPSMSG